MAKIYLNAHPSFMDLKVETGHHTYRLFGYEQNINEWFYKSENNIYVKIFKYSSSFLNREY